MPPLLQSCQQIAKKLILIDEPEQTNFKKVPQWLDLVEPSVEGKMEKMAKFWLFFGKKGRYGSKNLIFDKILGYESGHKKKRKEVPKLPDFVDPKTHHHRVK